MVLSTDHSHSLGEVPQPLLGKSLKIQEAFLEEEAVAWGWGLPRAEAKLWHVGVGTDAFLVKGKGQSA